jgi:hypothetical protein
MMVLATAWFMGRASVAMRAFSTPSLLSSEWHHCEKGRYGFGLDSDDPTLSTWPNLYAKWFKKQGFLGRHHP